MLSGKITYRGKPVTVDAAGQLPMSIIRMVGAPILIAKAHGWQYAEFATGGYTITLARLEKEDGSYED